MLATNSLQFQLVNSVGKLKLLLRQRHTYTQVCEFGDWREERNEQNGCRKLQSSDDLGYPAC